MLPGLAPGSRVSDASGRAWVVVTVDGDRLECLPLDGEIGRWVAARGWHKTAFYFHTITRDAREVTPAPEGTKP